MNDSAKNLKPALARITIAWYIIGFYLMYELISPNSILGYLGFIFAGLFVSNLLPAIVARILILFGIPPSVITNIERYNPTKPWQHN